MDLKQLLSQTTIQSNTTEGITEDEDITEGIDESIGEDNGEDIDESIGEGDGSHDQRFLQHWNKLEKGMKMNRILLFIETQKEECSLSDNQSKDLKNLLFRACESGLFNKTSEVKYNEEEGYIVSFKYLEFNESSKKYKLKTGSTKNRSVSKSRSNIDRLMKKK